MNSQDFLKSVQNYILMQEENMRRNVIFIIVVVLFSNGCEKNKNPLISNYSSTYFPLHVGNTWYYDEPTPQIHPENIRTIKSLFIKNNTVYYEWGSGEGVDEVDTICADNQGNIYNLKNNTKYLWFNFNKRDGSKYDYNYPESWGEHMYYFKVSVKKNITRTTPAGVFENCIRLTFDCRQLVDEEIYYTFAPNVGLIRIDFNGWGRIHLYSAIINGDKIGN
jgi:hypothetical protein